MTNIYIPPNKTHNCITEKHPFTLKSTKSSLKCFVYVRKLSGGAARKSLLRTN